MNITYPQPQTDSLLGISNDTIFTVSVTIAIFVLGYIFNRVYENAKHKRELRDLKEFLIVYLHSLIKPIEKQIAAFKTLSADILSKKHQDFAYGDAMGAKLDILDSLTQTDIFKVFLLGSKKEKSERITQYNNMLDALEYVNRQRSLAKDQFKDFMINYGKYIEQWNNAVNAVVRYQEQFVSFAMRTDTPPNQDPFTGGFNKLVHQWSQLDNREEMDQVAEHLLEPLRLLCKQHQSDPRIHVVIPPVLDSLQALRNRNNLISMFGKYLEDQASDLQAKRDRLAGSIKCLEESE